MCLYTEKKYGDWVIFKSFKGQNDFQKGYIMFFFYLFNGSVVLFLRFRNVIEKHFVVLIVEKSIMHASRIGIERYLKKQVGEPHFYAEVGKFIEKVNIPDII